MYLALMGLAAILFLYLVSARGYYPGIWTAWPVAMLLAPGWTKAQFGGLGLDFRGVVAVAAVVVLMFGQRGRANKRVVVLDVLVLLMALAHAASIAVNDSIRPTLPPMLVMIYAPYIIGRRYMTSADELPRVVNLMAAVYVILIAHVVVESLSRVNLLAVLTNGRVPYDVRMGLRRASGSVQHPIALGNILVLGLPCILVAARRARAEGGPAWCRYGPWLFVAGIIGTISRGPILAAVGTKGVDIFFRRPMLRVPLLLLALGVGVAATYGKEAVIGALQSISGENQSDPDEERIVVINGKEYKYTGTSHRILQFEVYREAMANAGLFGFGAAFESGDNEESGSRFWSIDNHYILTIVKRGWAGFGLFLGATVVAIFYFGKLALSHRPASELAGIYAGAVLCVALNLLTVWLDPSLNVAYLFTLGLAANLHTLPAVEPDPDDESDDEVELSHHLELPAQE